MSEAIQTKNFEETKNVGQEFAKKLSGGDVVCLYGDLGSGKTTFVQGMAEGFGIEKIPTSPTFLILRTYAVLQNKQIQMFYHVDLYRASEQDLQNLGVTDFMKEKESILAIEWAERMGKLLPKKRWDVHFFYKDEDVREINIEKIS